LPFTNLTATGIAPELHRTSLLIPLNGNQILCKDEGRLYKKQIMSVDVMVNSEWSMVNVGSRLPLSLPHQCINCCPGFFKTLLIAAADIRPGHRLVDQNIFVDGIELLPRFKIGVLP